MAETVLPPLQGEWVLHTQNVRSSEPTRVGQMDISRSEKSRDPQVAGCGRVFIGYRHRLSYFRLGMAQAV